MSVRYGVKRRFPEVNSSSIARADLIVFNGQMRNQQRLSARALLNGQAFTTLATPSGEHLASAERGHPRAKAVAFRPFTGVRLVCTLHGSPS